MSTPLVIGLAATLLAPSDLPAKRNPAACNTWTASARLVS